VVIGRLTLDFGWVPLGYLADFLSPSEDYLVACTKMVEAAESHRRR
jgi:hypothetical protein